MSLSHLITRWRGALLSLIGIVATVWLGITGQLGLYIHPRYFAFSIIMAVVAAAVVIVSFALSPGDEHAGHDHEAETGHKRFWAGASSVVIAASAVALLVLPPTTLTTTTLEQRDLNGSAAALTEEASAKLTGGDASKFSVKDWASLLRQGAGVEFYAGKKAQLTGFVTPDQDDPENVFYVARFVVSHCVVDAQPVGVPVYRPGWQDEFPLDSWVGVSGGLTANPSVASSEGIVIIPEVVAAVDQPQQPYVY
ncbi:TIGR03943 family protein [Cryobacterium sp. Hb1]|nr:TIGR03943 family protein [Cryobacterium sp. Hb1]